MVLNFVPWIMKNVKLEQEDVETLYNLLNK